eukprot:m.62678 g.62678  ORF g.62678 m.62678 type:complete len:996 (-) comp13376_c0_seq3:134-3121(-)
MHRFVVCLAFAALAPALVTSESMRVPLGLVGLTEGNPPVREVINFDFAWRHFLGPVPDPARKCGRMEKNFNYGTGGTMHSGIDDPAECCALCANTTRCVAWDVNLGDKACWTKETAVPAVPASGHVAGTIPASPTPPASKKEFDDSAWLLVDAPHDMLINQSYGEENSPTQGFLPRGEGWYRKHFTVPSDWNDGQSEIWVYFEGVFHVTTAWLNSEPLGAPHPAGYTSFALRLDNSSIQYGQENVLSLHVDASYGDGWWYEGGGLFRHQFLVKAFKGANLGAHAGDGVFAFAGQVSEPKPTHNGLMADSASLHVYAYVANGNPTSVGSHPFDAGPLTARITVVDADGKVAAGPLVTSAVSQPAGGQNTTLQATLPVADVQLWSVPRPYLYNVQTEVLLDGKLVDIAVVSFGFRVVEFNADTGLLINNQHVKARGFCDHSNFGGMGSAVPDRVNLFRTQMLRSVGGNAWRMAHNPPIPARLDFTDALGVVVMDENRDFGGGKQQGGETPESIEQEHNDMRDLVVRDRNRASVIMWSFCNEVGCDNNTAARGFRQVAYAADGTRVVTQNHLGTNASTFYLDVQGFSHKSGDTFDSFHKANPHKPMIASECCSCLSQRGVDSDTCPKPRPGGCTQGCRVDCKGPYTGDNTDGVFYNNEISQCTGTQISRSDSREFMSGTFVWSGFDYFGESRGWPQTVKARGAIADIAGFYKESYGWLKAWWLANIGQSDAGRPNVEPDLKFFAFVPESWVPPQGASKGKSTRVIHVYTNAPAVALLVNGKPAKGGDKQTMPFFGTAEFDNVEYEAGNLTAVAYDNSSRIVATHTVMTPGEAVAIRLVLDAPSAATGTGTVLVADGEDVAMLRAEIVDIAGHLVNGASNNVTFTVVSGGGRVAGTHSGNPASHVAYGSSTYPAYHGLARAFVRSTEDRATPLWHRHRLAQVHADTPMAHSTVVTDANAAVDPIVVSATADGLKSDQLSIPVTANLTHLPVFVARRGGV